MRIEPCLITIGSNDPYSSKYTTPRSIQPIQSQFGLLYDPIKIEDFRLTWLVKMFQNKRITQRMYFVVLIYAFRLFITVKKQTIN